MAQLVEHIVHIDGVTGSSPVATTTKPRRHKAFEVFFISGEDADFHFGAKKWTESIMLFTSKFRRIPNNPFFFPVRRGVQNRVCSSSCITKCLPLELPLSVWLTWQALCSRCERWAGNRCGLRAVAIKSQTASKAQHCRIISSKRTLHSHFQLPSYKHKFLQYKW